MSTARAFLVVLATATCFLGTAVTGTTPLDPVPSGPHPTSSQAVGLPELSEASLECIDCHKRESLALYQQWGSSRHFRANVGCYECHKAVEDDSDVLKHYDYNIATIVSPKDCARCHAKEAEEFLGSRHSAAGRIAGSPENFLAEVVEGNRGLKTPGFEEGVSAAAVSGCWQCHGSPVKVMEGGRLDPVTWPNTGIGRLNPDGTEGSCTACHSRHVFSVEQARHPDTCGRCHQGPDHPQKEIYEGSKHGVAFSSSVDKMSLAANKWVVAEDYWVAPTCTTCHMSATKNQQVSHDIGTRVSWNNRGIISKREKVKRLSWEMRRAKMHDVCVNCHSKTWVDNFYVQYDGVVALYNEKFATPGIELYELSAPLRKPVTFSEKVDFTWYELWHNEGRRARFAASMMGPDYTHWHGTYDLAKNFYTEYIPQLEELVERGLSSGDPEKVEAAGILKAKIEEVLDHDNHKWYLGKMDPVEAAARAEAAQEFEDRHK